jgi:flagellin
MAMNSLTNYGAMVALQSLNKTNDALAATQKRVSTGMRVADAKDDGAAFAVAQRVRGDVSALTSANEQLNGSKGLLDTTSAGLTGISDQMNAMRAVLVKLADGTVTGDQRTQYVAQYNSDLANVKSSIQDATYNANSLINSFGTNADAVLVRNESGDTYTVAKYDASAMYAAITIASSITAGDAAALITAGGTFQTKVAEVGTQLNTYSAASKYITNTVNYNQQKIDALNGGLGALVDADLAKESANMQSLQIRQQLGTQALSMANQAPQALLSLFK